MNDESEAARNISAPIVGNVRVTYERRLCDAKARRSVWNYSTTFLANNASVHFTKMQGLREYKIDNVKAQVCG